MIKIKVPATSANVGPGFDTFGLALNIFNTFYVDKSETLIIENTDEKFKNKDNLLVSSYNKTLASKGIEEQGLYVRFEDIQIPIARGLGSSSSLVVAGVLAANKLHNLELSMEEMLDICNDIEGHPDNVAPCLYGGFVTSLVDSGKAYTKKIDVHSKFNFTVFVPDFEVETSEARRILPQKIDMADAIFSLSRAISMCFALQDGNEEALRVSFQDKIHDPYRRTLIPDYDDLQKEVLKNGALAFVISGSGSTCLAISLDKSFSKKLNTSNLKAKWKLIDCEVYRENAEVREI